MFDESIEEIMDRFTKLMCIACSDITTLKKLESEDIRCDSHYMCSKCRIKYFHVRSKHYCKCGHPYSEEEKSKLRQILSKTCSICFIDRREDHPKKCEICDSVICKVCTKDFKILNQCIHCSEHKCSRCGNILGTRFKIVENLFYHSRCKQDINKECSKGSLI